MNRAINDHERNCPDCQRVIAEPRHLPPPLIYAATGLAEELSAAGWTVSVRVYPPYGPEDNQPDPILDVWRDADPEVAAR